MIKEKKGKGIKRTNEDEGHPPPSSMKVAKLGILNHGG